MKKWAIMLLSAALGWAAITSAQAQHVVGQIEEMTRLYVRPPQQSYMTFSLGTGSTLCPAHTFYQLNFANIDEAKAGYALLLTAVSSGKKVKVGNPTRLEGSTNRCKTEVVNILGF